MKSISVALASYNGEQYICEQLTSIASQTIKPDEIVISDDGSNDNTVTIARQFAQKSPFPVNIIINKKKLGFADNFLNAAEQCKCDLIAFCDQDDVWLPNKLETCYSRMIEDDSLIALHKLNITDEKLNLTGLQWDQGIALDHVFDPLILDPFQTGFGNSMMFRRELLYLIDRSRRPRQPFFPERPLSHDTWIYMLAAALGKVSHIADALILYRQHNSNASGALNHRNSLFDSVSIPLNRYKEQCIINQSMKNIFSYISETSNSFAQEALAAAQVFEKRRYISNLKIKTYDGENFSERHKSYRKYLDAIRNFSIYHQDLNIKSQIKTIVLGVAKVRIILPNSGIRKI